MKTRSNKFFTNLNKTFGKINIFAKDIIKQVLPFSWVNGKNKLKVEKAVKHEPTDAENGTTEAPKVLISEEEAPIQKAEKIKELQKQLNYFKVYSNPAACNEIIEKIKQLDSEADIFEMICQAHNKYPIYYVIEVIKKSSSAMKYIDFTDKVIDRITNQIKAEYKGYPISAKVNINYYKGINCKLPPEYKVIDFKEKVAKEVKSLKIYDEKAEKLNKALDQVIEEINFETNPDKCKAWYYSHTMVLKSVPSTPDHFKKLPSKVVLKETNPIDGDKVEPNLEKQVKDVVEEPSLVMVASDAFGNSNLELTEDQPLSLSGNLIE